MTVRRPALMVLGLAAMAACGALADDWRVFYGPQGFAAGAAAWLGDKTHSERTPDGLLVADPSTEKGSGRTYWLDWRADPARGAGLEAKVKVKSCSAPWGVHLGMADGIHEEGLTLYPDRVELENAKLKAPLNTTDRFHT